MACVQIERFGQSASPRQVPPLPVGKKQRRELRSRGLPGLQYPKVPHSWPGSQIAPRVVQSPVVLSQVSPALHAPQRLDVGVMHARSFGAQNSLSWHLVGDGAGGSGGGGGIGGGGGAPAGQKWPLQPEDGWPVPSQTVRFCAHHGPSEPAQPPQPEWRHWYWLQHFPFSDGGPIGPQYRLISKPGHMFAYFDAQT